ncbi:hypothetical protein PIROE2DRAFT_15931 [Piromyces sp. E2]|nr:hypothetical protein PIROE2DRAFT_15931 [Piromyces sp. E2]|eukprot:OUM58714.1 hypothetical protein PIROE2DRAFT_15931 [Piromyces sp. E2]
MYVIIKSNKSHFYIQINHHHYQGIPCNSSTTTLLIGYSERQRLYYTNKPRMDK